MTENNYEEHVNYHIQTKIGLKNLAELIVFVEALVSNQYTKC